MAQRNILEVLPLQSYNQTLNYYNRVTNDSGTLIEPYDVDRIYHELNLLSLQNRSYKLYHASAGLHKTSDQIDKLYDLGKNDVDQTFSGSDRPEHIQAWSNSGGVGNWQISVEKESTNYCKESNHLGSIVGGNWTKTEGAGDSPFGDSNEAVEVEMNTNSTGASNYIHLAADTANTFSSGNYVTISFYAKKIAGSSGKPRLHLEDSNGNTLFNEAFETNVGEYQFFELTAQFSADAEISSTVQRIEDNDTSADTVYQVWGMQIETGRFATNRIYTNGSIVTRLKNNISLNNVIDGRGDQESTFAIWIDFYMLNREERNFFNFPQLFNFFSKNPFIPIRLQQRSSDRILGFDCFNIGADASNDHGIFLETINPPHVEYSAKGGGYRNTIFVCFSYKNGECRLYGGDLNGNLHLHNVISYDPTTYVTDDFKPFERDRPPSNRYLKIFSSLKYYRQDEVINLFKKTGTAIFNNFSYNKFLDVRR